MRFVIKQAGCGSERVGNLTGFLKSPGAVIETPTSALLTQGASVVHLTADVLGKVFTSPQLLWIPLSNTVHFEPGLKVYGEGVTKFAALPDHIACMTLQSSNDVIPTGHFQLDKLPLWTKHGKKMITADRYMELMEVFKPDIVLAIADSHIAVGEGNKRIAKAIERTGHMLETCIKRYKASPNLQQCALIGVIIGSAQDKKCDISVQNILKYKDELKGVALAGLTDGTENSLNIPTEQLDSIFKKISEALPEHILRIVEGCWNPAVIVAAVEHGWDMFDGTYPLKLTNAGKSLGLNFDVNQNSEELCILDLIDVRYKDDFRPILAGCECLACKKHTRAYIRHLLNTREMLANVLLNIHNLHHFDQLFVHCRQHIASKTFSIFKNHITQQYESYKQASITNGQNCEGESVKANGVHQNGDNSENRPQQEQKKIRTARDLRNATPTAHHYTYRRRRGVSPGGGAPAPHLIPQLHSDHARHGTTDNLRPTITVKPNRSPFKQRT